MKQNKLDSAKQLDSLDFLATRKRIGTILKKLENTISHFPQPASLLIVKKFGRDPFLILIGCILSLRTHDTTSQPAAERLFAYAKNPQSMLNLDINAIEKLIYPVGFYHRKARQVHQVCKQLLEKFNGEVPCDEKDLLSLAGVGRKTMNLVLWEAFRIPAICVDTHVHRISNRLGLVVSKTPEETEMQLRALVPEKLWGKINQLFVQLGQNICVPISPKCSTCPLFDLCPKIGVTKSR